MTYVTPGHPVKAGAGYDCGCGQCLAVRAVLTELPPLNASYDPPRPWRCITQEPHDCDGQVIGSLGAIPVCAAGAVVEEAARIRDRARQDAWAASPEGRRMIAEEAAIERWIEFR